MSQISVAARDLKARYGAVLAPGPTVALTSQQERMIAALNAAHERVHRPPLTRDAQQLTLDVTAA